MMIKIVIILALSQINILTFAYIIDGYGNIPINYCANYMKRCNVSFEVPCCQENYSCKLVGWKEQQGVFACVKQAYLGGYCENSIDCIPIDYAVCNERNECECTTHLSPENENRCAPLEKNTCLMNRDCKAYNSICSNHLCTCKPSFTTYFKNECVPTRLGQICNNDHDCMDIMHSKCSENGQCICRPHHIIKNDASCASLLGGYCQHDDQCGTQNSACIDHKCQCKKKFLATSLEECTPTPLGGICDNDNDCSGVWNARCSANKRCVCHGYNKAINETICGALLGETCFDGELCAVENSMCVENKCRCKANFKEISNEKCVQTKFGHPCEKSIDCEDVLHYRCSDKRCVCQENHVLLNNSTCAPLLGEYCRSNEECGPKNSVCIFNTCQCKSGYIQTYKDRCVLEKLGLPCESNIDCRDLLNAVCSENKVCVCEKHNVFIEQLKGCYYFDFSSMDS